MIGHKCNWETSVRASGSVTFMAAPGGSCKDVCEDYQLGFCAMEDKCPFGQKECRSDGTWSAGAVDVDAVEVGNGEELMSKTAEQAVRNLGDDRKQVDKTEKE